jgi:hypothetical protein
MKRGIAGVALVLLLTWLVLVSGLATAQAPAWKPDIPRTWDEAALADWATPVAGLNVRPTHLSSSQYYSLPLENLRSFPVYAPDREPRGYWEMLQKIGPTPLVDPTKLKTEADWVQAGARVFMDWAVLRTFDPKLIAMARDKQALDQRGAQPQPDGTISALRWLPTKDGIALGFANCSACHLMYLPDNTRVPGASSFALPGGFRNALGTLIRTAERVLPGEAPFVMGGASVGSWLYQAYAAPWVQDPVSERLKALTEADHNQLVLANFRGGAVARWNGSLFYPAKVPDLIGIKDRKYIDHTATHQHRGIGDLMRYAALVSFADSADFGEYHMLAADTRRFAARLPDEALYALSLYIYSLKPPSNPNPSNEKTVAGEAIFRREGCVSCHTPPLYTNNKLTLAAGFSPPKENPASLDAVSVSVGTDPGLALRTRKGTGYYKVPSLKGLWYRGHYLHDGAVGSLEEMFDPDRLKDSHVRGGWIEPGLKTKAIPGHEFGLRLDLSEREQLIAFLKTL